jgi:mannose-6-phosphate isomerase class I
MANGVNWDRVSWGKCKTLFLVEAFKKDIPLDKAEPMAELWATASMQSLAEVNAKKSDDEVDAEIAKKSVDELF